MSAPLSEVETTNSIPSPIAGGAELLGGLRQRFWGVAVQESVFLAVVLCGMLLAAVTFQTPAAAMWVGFAFAAYGVTSNDSIQTIGTFLASNGHRPWYILWLYVGGIFLLTVGYSWVVFDGDVSFQRLTAKGFETAPTRFSYLQVIAPLFLLFLTRMRVPVSTTFVVLSAFAASASSMGSVIQKSMGGYIIAFVVAISVWTVVSRFADRLFAGDPHPLWVPVQWVTTALLWSAWLMQDAANVAVFLPRQLTGMQFLAFAGVMFLGLGVLFYMRGDRLQQVVDEKTDIVDVRAATLVDVVYTLILWFFMVQSNVPMSTTWVFVGLLAGREIGIAWSGAGRTGMGRALKMVGRDLAAVCSGLIFSVILAAAINPVIADELKAMMGGLFGA